MNPTPPPIAPRVGTAMLTLLVVGALAAVALAPPSGADAPGPATTGTWRWVAVDPDGELFSRFDLNVIKHTDTNGDGVLSGFTEYTVFHDLHQVQDCAGEGPELACGRHSPGLVVILRTDLEPDVLGATVQVTFKDNLNRVLGAAATTVE